MNSGNNSIIDFKDIQALWRILAKNWYWPVLFGLIGYGIAMIYTHQLTDIYGARTQLLLKSDDIMDYQESLYRGFDYGQFERLSNQKRVITSANLIEAVVDKLNLQVSYFIEGRLKTTELYKEAPFEVRVMAINNGLREQPVYLKVLNEKSFILSYAHQNENYQIRGKFGEAVEDGRLKLMVDKRMENIGRLSPIDYFFMVHHKRKLINHYQRSIEVENIEYTAILQVTVEDPIPDRAAVFLDTLSRVYIDYSLQSKIDINENTQRYIDMQLDGVMGILDGIEDSLDVYKATENILNLGVEESKYYEELANYELEDKKMEMNLDALEELETYLLEDKAGKLLPPSIYLEMGNDKYLANTVQEFYELQLQRASVMYKTTDKNPTIEQVDEQLKMLKNNILNYLGNVRKAFLKNRERIQGQIGYYESVIKGISPKQRDMTRINRQLQVNEKMYLFLLEKRVNITIARAGIIPQTKVIESAHSIGRIKPDKNKVTAYFIACSLVLSLILIFIRMLFFYRIESTEELKEQTNLPVLGGIALHKAIAGEEYYMVNREPKSPLAESFRQVRTNLQYLLPQESKKVVLVTSNNPGEGKTFCSVNLAIMLAMAHKKVLLMEFDLHKPRIQKAFDISSDLGLSSYLIGKAEMKDVLHREVRDNLDLVFSGPLPPNPSELVLSPRMKELFAHAREHYDYIIVDTPPVRLISDPVVLMKHVDAVMYVQNTRAATRESLRFIKEITETKKLNNVGLVLNGVKKRKFGYYKYSYGYGYGYGYGEGYGDAE